MDQLLEHCDILYLEETFPAKQHLTGLKSINDNFHSAGKSSTNLSLGTGKGSIPGSVEILWNKNLDSVVNVLRIGVDWLNTWPCMLKNL